MSDEDKTRIQTSDPAWFEKVMKKYADGQSFRLVDDAAVGITAAQLTSGIDLLRAAKLTLDLPWRDISTVIVGLGISYAGYLLIVAAIVDPEPTTKLGLFMITGAVLMLGGSFSAIAALRKQFKVRGKVGDKEFVVEVE